MSPLFVTSTRHYNQLKTIDPNCVVLTATPIEVRVVVIET